MMHGEHEMMKKKKNIMKGATKYNKMHEMDEDEEYEMMEEGKKRGLGKYSKKFKKLKGK